VKIKLYELQTNSGIRTLAALMQPALNYPAPIKTSAGSPVSTGHKFGERRRPVVSSTFVAVRDVDLLDLLLQCQLPGLAVDSPRHLASLPHEATLVGYLASAVDDRSVPQVEQDLRATIWQ
jgi:hypothetical protein